MRGRYLERLYGTTLGLATDLYQVTMAYGYWKKGLADRKAVFHLTFRRAPFDGAFSIVAGIEPMAELVENLRFGQDDLAYLATLEGEDGKRLFDNDFLELLSRLHFTVDIDAMPEGSCHFPGAPLLRVEGPLIQAQLLETPILALINYASTVATRASRVCHIAAPGEGVLEFGLRRAPSLDGAVAASRSAYIGGCLATSNLLAGRLFGIPVAGTQAHSWVMSFDSELEAFLAYAECLPDNLTLLVDTYDTLRGVERAICAGEEARLAGYDLDAIRLDSGDFIELSKKARKLLDDAGFESSRIVASNSLDEHEIARLKRGGARVDLWGVGTSVVSSLNTISGVYKLSLLEAEDGTMVPKVKRSETPAKASWPGRLQVLRSYEAGRFVSDLVIDQSRVEPEDPRSRMLQPLLRDGQRVKLESGSRRLEDIRQRVAEELAALPDELIALEWKGESRVHHDETLVDLRSRLLDARR